MVGVPGRSKGCTTCRRRKIKCDQAKPSCTRCQQSGRPCEGYEKYPIFLIRTVAGIEKRKALEEVKPRQQPPPCINESTISTSPATTKRFVATSTQTLIPINTAPVIFRRIESAFLEDYLPVCNNSRTLATWLVNIIDRGERSKALQVSLQALAMTRVGRAAANDTLVAQGRVVYGMALRELQVALWDKRLAVADDTLAAARALAFYELSESSSNSVAAWNSHEKGVARLVQLRGPDTYDGGLARDIFLSVRCTAMIQALQFRRSSFLGDAAWQTRPFQNSPKNKIQGIYDQGFKLATILENLDIAKTNYKPGKMLMDAMIEGLQRCADLDDDLECCYVEFVLQSEEPIYTHVKGSTMADEMEFTSFTHADFMMYYWALRSLLSMVAATICQSIPPELMQAQPFLVAARDWRRNCIEVARKIVDSTPYLLRKEMGSLSAQRTIFPLRCAMGNLERFECPELEHCRSLYRQLAEKKRWSFSRDVAKVNGPWYGCESRKLL